MPVQPVVSLEQIVIIVAFLLLLFGIMWFIKRHRSGITRRIHADRRMQHIEDLSLAPQQRLHLIEVDGRTFLIHAGKGHAASLMPVDGTPPPPSSTPKDRADTPRRRVKPATGKSPSASDATQLAKPKSAFAAAIAQARLNNPSLEFGK